MSEESGNLDQLVESVADGESLDWTALEKGAPTGESQQLIQLLHMIAEVGEVHRSDVDEKTPDGGESARSTVEVVGPVAAGAQARRTGSTPIHASEGTWGHLLLIRKIGEGSFGEVYRAHDTWLDHPVALKLLKRGVERRVSPSQLLHEARTLARVRHANVVTVHGADRHDGRVGFWMDFVDGETLATILSRGRFSAGEATHVGQEVCRALAAVHAAKLVHRDVKAQNVMRAFDGGRIILMDFGAGEFVDDPPASKRAEGTPLYLAPELLRGDSASVRSDIYAVGVLIYHLVTGRFPVEARSLAALVETHARGARRRLRDERPELPTAFVAAIERALEPDPERRYRSAGEMEAALGGEPVVRDIANGVSITPAPASSMARVAGRVGGIAAGAVALTGVVGFIAARAFETVLRIDPDFFLGPAATFRVGAEALLPVAVVWILGTAVVGVLLALRTLVPEPLGELGRRVRSALTSARPEVLGTVVFLGGVAMLVAITWRFRMIFAALLALRQNPQLPAAALTVFNEASRAALHTSHGIYSSVLSFLLMLAVWRWFPSLEKRGTADVSTLRFMKWGTVAVGFAAIALTVAPRRVVWEQFSLVLYDGRPALVLGATSQEFLLYEPDEPGRPRVRVKRDAPSLRQTGESRSLFGRGQR